jgi:DNA polymerase
MVQALSHGLPGSLDQLCETLKVPQDKAKIKDGKRLIQLFCKPRPKNSKIPRATRETHPEEWQRFIEYAMADIDAMREVQKRLPAWNYPREPELSHWHLDQIINDRGVMVDTVSANAMLHAVGREKERLGKKTAELTDGKLESTTQVQATIEYIFEEYGVHTDDLTKAQVSALLANDEVPEPVKEILRLRKQAGSSSTSKYKALLNRVDEDQRFRGGIQFSGAARTRRASGRGFQPQNLPSRGLLDDSLVELGIEAVKLGCEDLLFENVMHLASSAIRPMLIAAPGRGGVSCGASS